jgi:hypothetical protein
LYHEVCIGAVGRKQFICGKCLWLCSLKLDEQNDYTAERISPIFFIFLFITSLSLIFNCDYTVKHFHFL